ncbi:DUF2523 family protein [Pseudomonas aeruginosa]
MVVGFQGVFFVFEHRDALGEGFVGLAFFGVPQALNIIMVAAATRFCMRFVPFIGR